MARDQSGAEVDHWRAGTGATTDGDGERHVSEWAWLFRSEPREQ